MKNNFWLNFWGPILFLALMTLVTASCDSDDNNDEKDTDTSDAGVLDAGDSDTDTTPKTTTDSESATGPTEAKVTTPLGEVTGEVLTDKRSGAEILRFRGIPYAKPPVGDLRWAPPVPVEPWSETLECTEWPNRAPQPEDNIGLGTISEDCLHVNVVTPAVRDGLLPVMVFFHGGGLTVHTGNSEVYNNTALPAEGVVVVTVNMRLGTMGYLAHPALTAESANGASGNYGTLDMIESLKWVRDNIESFGGDKGNVTIFGESGGGSKVISVLSSPLAKGLFHRAMVESGSGSVLGETADLATNEAAGVVLQEALGITGDAAAPATLAAMRAKTMDEILAIDFGATLTVDGWALEESIPDLFKAGKQINVPLVVGAQTRDIATELVSGVPALAGFMSAIQKDTYVYVFSHLPANWRSQETCAAFHGLELPYVFGKIPEGLDAQIITMFAEPLCKGEPGADEADDRAAQYGVKLWAQFAKTGNPNYEGISVTWPAYAKGEGKDYYLEIADPLKVGTDPSSAQIPAPAAVMPTLTEYHNTEYGFKIQYPDTWVDRDMMDNEIWRKAGLMGIPALRVIVRPVTDGDTLQKVFEAQLSAEGKTIGSFDLTANVEINGMTYDKAVVKSVASSSSYEYESVIIGKKIESDAKWIVFEVYTVMMSFDPPELPNAILETVTWD